MVTLSCNATVKPLQILLGQECGKMVLTVENYHLWMGFYVISNASKSSDGLLESLDPNKANGHDGISAKILKTGAEEISLSLSTIYNSCIKKGQCPCDWKKGDWTVVY